MSLIAGPSHDVWTENGETNAWFGEQLDLDDATPRRQSQYGVLVEVKDAQIESVTSSKMTEVLFYASAEVDPAGNDDSDPIFRLKALPLSSELLTYLPSPPSSPRASEEDAQFLPSVEALRNLALSKEKKRKQVTGVFDEAAEIRRKARRKGGESVAAAASRVDGVNILVGQKKPKQPIKASSKETSTTITRQHSRTGSFTTLSQDNPRRPPSRSPSVSSDTRPTSRRGVVDTMNKRSGLSRMASFSEATTTEDRNKETISRLVMAGMRLYGLQQRKKTGHARRVSEMNAQASAASQDPVGPTEAAKDEEYKLIYHQTYKGTVFAFVSLLCAM